jgi:coenzyme PQQ precursor peptide PqqA
LSAQLPANWSTGLDMGPVFLFQAPVARPACMRLKGGLNFCLNQLDQGKHMAWTTPILVEICLGLEINGYLPAEF